MQIHSRGACVVSKSETDLDHLQQIDIALHGLVVLFLGRPERPDGLRHNPRKLRIHRHVPSSFKMNLEHRRLQKYQKQISKLSNAVSIHLEMQYVLYRSLLHLFPLPLRNQIQNQISSNPDSHRIKPMRNELPIKTKRNQIQNRISSKPDSH